MSSLKRKHLDSSDDSASDQESSSYPSCNLPLPKRRRFDLTRNLSRLSLFEQAQVQAQAHVQIQQQPTLHHQPTYTPPDQVIITHNWPTASSPVVTTQVTMDMDGDVPGLDVMLPIVEEPADQTTIPDIRMRHSSSYELEKDRIVVTDLDSSEDESDTLSDTPSGNDNTFSVSPALLSRINSSKVTTPLLKTVAPPPESGRSQALVLFKPSPWAAKDAHELEGIYRTRDMEQSSHEAVVTEVEEPDPDAMEVE